MLPCIEILQILAYAIRLWTHLPFGVVIRLVSDFDRFDRPFRHLVQVKFHLILRESKIARAKIHAQDKA